MKPKYTVGDTVFLKKVFTPENGGTYTMHEEVPIYAQVVRVDKSSSMGYCYELKPVCDTYLGGVMYWESDISGLAATAAESEEQMWKMWGDK